MSMALTAQITTALAQFSSSALARASSALLLGDELGLHQLLRNVSPPGLAGVLGHLLHVTRRRRPTQRLRNVPRTHLPRKQVVAGFSRTLAEETGDPKPAFVDIPQ
jgi:hypothetical protein